MRRLTSQQIEALRVVSASVSLSSGAGCGKTTVLAERFLRAIDQEERGLGSIVALTFTDKAARELRGRVRAECRRRLHAPGPDSARWRAVLRGLEAAPIGTFHSFCQGVLSRFPIEAGVEPGFGILDEVLAPSVRGRSLSGRIRSWLAEGHPDLIAVAVEFGLENVRSILTDLISRHGPDDFARWFNASDEEVVRSWERVWEDQGRAVLLRNLVHQTREILDFLVAHPCSHPVMVQRIDHLHSAVPSLPSHPDPIAALIEIRENATVQGGGGKSHWPSEAVYERAKKLLERLRVLSKAVESKLSWDRDASLTLARLGQRFARLAYEARLAYDQEKQAAGLLDFDDLLIKTRELLIRHGDTVRIELAGSAELILVDEFQDTDPLQGEILELLAGETLDTGRLFLVGDSKQSIYRFRGAQPRIFETYRERFPTAGRRELTQNYRSLPALLSFVNHLFADSFNDSPLTPGIEPPTNDPTARVTFLWCHEPNDESKPNADQRRRQEARWLARLIASRIASGRTVYDRSLKAFRSMRAGDVVFLFRTLNDAASYESALVEEGLDYHIVGGSAFFAQQEIIDVINLLSAIDDPLDALSLASTLRSPFFGVSDEGLYWLASHHDTTGLGDLVGGFESGRLLSGFSSSDREGVDRARSLLATWRAIRDSLSMADFLDRVLSESGYEAALMAEPLGPRKRANVRKLVALARRFDLQGGWALADFVARLREDLRKPPREEQAATTEEEGNRVRLMTVHQAKGLEFPCVVLPDLNRDGGTDRDSAVFRPDMGVVVRPSSDAEVDPEAERGSTPSLGWIVHQQLEEFEDEAESVRLFYVATTRAVSDLILSAGFDVAEDMPRSPALRLLSRRFDLSTGDPRVVTEPGNPPPAVEVVLSEPPSAIPSRASRTRHGLDRLAVAQLIRDAFLLREDDLASRRSCPTMIDLDPSLTLPPTSARLDRLLRAVLREPEAFKPMEVVELVRRLGQRQAPVASSALRHRVIGRLRDWINQDGDLTARLARDRGLRRAVNWQLAWPFNGDAFIMIRGVTDFLIQGRKGEWGVLLVSDPLTPEPAEQLRIKLSAIAAQRFGHGTVSRGRIVRLGDQELEVIDEIGFEAEAITRAINQYLDIWGHSSVNASPGL